VIYFEDARTKIEIIGHAVSVLPVPHHDAIRAHELRALFPAADGWIHYPRGVGQTATTPEGRVIVARMAEERLTSAGRRASA
jgi:hypothetical protein